MITVAVYPNPLDATKREVREVPDCTTLRALTREHCGNDEWPVPTFALVNGAPVLRERWNDPLPDGSMVEFRSVLEGGKTGSMIISGAMVAAGVVMIATGFGAAAGVGLIIGGAAGLASAMLSPSMAKPETPVGIDAQSGSPTYSVGYRANQKRVGEPIPIVYGRHRMLPDLVSATYSWYAGADEQWIAIVLCLGVGELSVDTASLKFGEADFSQLQSVSYQVVNPGASLTLFRDRVVTSAAINGQTLLGPSPVIAHTTHTTVSVNYQAWAGATGLIIASQPVFAGIAYGDSLTFSGASNSGNNGTFVCVGALNSQQIFIYPWGGTAETTTGLTITKGGVKLWTNPVSLTVSASTKRITGPAGTFLGSRVGWVMTVSYSTSNNGTYPVTAIASDGSWIETSSTLVNETTTGIEVTSQEDGWSGWVEVAGPTDSITDIEVDLVAPKGLGTYYSGAVYAASVDTEIQTQGLDSSGAPVGSTYVQTLNMTRAQAKAARQSYRWANPTGYGRVRLRYRRTTAERTGSDALDTVVMGGAKGYLADKATYHGVTILAVMARASEQLTAQQAQQVSVVATRKLPIWSGTAWSATTATRSPAWALADALRSAEHGAGLPDDQIDLDALLALDAVWAGRGDTFDGVFDNGITAWEAVQKIARAGRAQPVLSGGVVTFVRDQARTVRAAMFSPANILPGTLSIDYRLPQEHDPDGTEVAWIDPDNNWQPAHIEYREGGGAILNPQQFDLFGVTDEAQATRESVYLDRCRKYQRKSLHWETEMDGHLVSVGDLVALAHDVPAWGQSAELIALSGTTYTLSEPMTWAPSGTHYALFRAPGGTVSGPHAVTAVSGHPEQFTCSASLGFTARTDLGNGDRTAVMFGVGTAYAQDVVITAVQPGSGQTVALSAIPYVAAIHASGA
jgi:hypothetical protein